jgi:ATP-dependent Clp protease adaptor protein ClpS
MNMTTEVVIDEKIKIEIKEPSLYHVVFLNDDKTPMDFVVALIVEIFKHSEETARDITLRIHEEGSGVVGTYTYEVAEQKALEAQSVCKENNFPLRIRVEEDT